LESLGYLLLYFLKGKLPWQGLQMPNKVEKYNEIGRMKEQVDVGQMCVEVSERAGKYCLMVGVLVRYFDEVKKIGFEETPDYDLLRKIFKEDLVRHKD